jgi:hypothetical protein
MSNYTPVEDWSVKDGLASGDADKTISGVDFDAEFAVVQTAINSKLDQYNGASADTTLGAADVISIYDGAYKKITVANARLQLSSEIATSFNVLLTTDITGNSISTWTTVDSTWGTERWDAAGTFSGYKWTPGAAGKYFLHAAMPLRGAATDLAADTDFGIRILQRNSSDTILTALASHQSTSVGGNVVATVSGSIADSANDNYYEVQAYVTSANWETYAATGQGVFGGWRMF